MIAVEDDVSLIAACLAGRTDAFGTLVKKYQDRLYPTALRLTGRPEDALDLLQDAFLRAFRKLDGFHGDSSFYTWIYRIAVNLALSRRRKLGPSRLKTLSTDDLREPADDSSDGDPASPMERAEREKLVQAALDDLAPDHRAVLVMKEFDDLRYEEIAAILEIPVGTVRSRLHRARGELRERLRALIDEPEPIRSGAADTPRPRPVL